MAARRRRPPIEPLALSFDYPGGRVDISVARLNVFAHDLSPARAALARRLIAARAKCAESAVQLTHDARGAPHVAVPSCGLRLSKAGRDDVVAAAVAEYPVGVDIEAIGAPLEPPFNVLHPAERALLVQSGDGAHEMFLRIWTAKEAYVKALRTGLSREPSEIEIRPGSAAAFDGPADFGVFDRGDRVRTLFARGGRLFDRQRAVMFACIILPC